MNDITERLFSMDDFLKCIDYKKPISNENIKAGIAGCVILANMDITKITHLNHNIMYEKAIEMMGLDKYKYQARGILRPSYATAQHFCKNAYKKKFVNLGRAISQIWYFYKTGNTNWDRRAIVEHERENPLPTTNNWLSI